MQLGTIAINELTLPCVRNIHAKLLTWYIIIYETHKTGD